MLIIDIDKYIGFEAIHELVKIVLMSTLFFKTPIERTELREIFNFESLLNFNLL